jgi:hypothetical protein
MSDLKIYEKSNFKVDKKGTLHIEIENEGVTVEVEVITDCGNLNELELMKLTDDTLDKLGYRCACECETVYVFTNMGVYEGDHSSSCCAFKDKQKAINKFKEVKEELIQDFKSNNQELHSAEGYYKCDDEYLYEEEAIDDGRTFSFSYEVWRNGSYDIDNTVLTLVKTVLQ